MAGDGNNNSVLGATYCLFYAITYTDKTNTDKQKWVTMVAVVVVSFGGSELNRTGQQHYEPTNSAD